MEVVHFRDETFANSMGILLDLAKAIPQCELPDAGRVRSDERLRERIHERALPVLEALMYVSRSVGGSAAQKLSAFAAENLDSGTLADFRLLQGSGPGDPSAVINTLELRHVEALYHALEDMHATVALQHLESRFD